MAAKRSRSTFEAELSRKESPYAFYGTPLPPLDSQTRDDGSYVPVWQQEVRDERGRKRLHGAFTGGFSAGYFNTVGSKEGWTPQTFVSSRTNRASEKNNGATTQGQKQKVEDFMDEEDIADAEDAKRLQTNAGYGGLGSTSLEHGGGGNNALMDVMRPSASESMGVKLLQRMGWRQGQGVGPRIKRKARVADAEADHPVENDDNDEGEEHLFAPSNSAMINFIKKSDYKGLGYDGELSLPRAIEAAPHQEREEDDDGDAAWSRNRSKFRTKVKKPKKINPSFGVGVLNDTGSDDEDPYFAGPKISYNRTIGGSGGDENKRPTATAVKKPAPGGANPLLTSRPVFMSKLRNTSKTGASSASGFRKCHDGRLPLDGFVLAMQALDISPMAKYLPPTVPDDWKAKRSRWDVKPAEEYASTAEAAKASTFDPKTRANALGEEALPGKSIFDFISPAARDKLAAASGNAALPQGRGEAAPAQYRLSEEDRQKQLWEAIPELSRNIALEALQRGASGWMPYADDAAKRARYRSFLELKAGIRPETERSLPERTKGMSKEDWMNELREFAQAAEVFRPISGAMASRFTSSRAGTYEGGTAPSADTETSLLTRPMEKPEDPAENAAKMGMYGLMTRSSIPFYPTRLLCKRFNVRPPANVVVDPSGETGADVKKEVKEMVGKKVVERMMMDAAVRRFESRGFENMGAGKEMQSQPGSGAATPKGLEAEAVAPVELVVDAERNEALEQERPGDAVFKAIFGSDVEDDD